MTNRQTRRQCDCLAKLFGGGRELTLLTKDQPEVVAGLRLFGTKTHRGFKRRARPVDVTRPPSSRAEMILSVEEARFELDSTREMFERDLRLAKLAPYVAESV